MATTAWISKQQAAERLGCSAKTIDRLRAAGELHAVKRGSKTQSRIQIEAASIEAYEQRQAQAAKKPSAWNDIEARFPIRDRPQEQRDRSCMPRATCTASAAGLEAAFPDSLRSTE